ncbi:MAG: SDR family oxidoreductase [Phycisphaerales bacterium]|nr:SDR family oxidoreductase [Phycisphaerales bacterium]
MRILVTGCAGFIGFHMCDRLLRDGHEVVGLDNVSTGQRPNVVDLSKNPRFQFVEHDLTQPLALDGSFERVFNFACPASPVDFDPRRLDILAVCSRGVWNLLDFCKRSGARLLHTSTSEVYGDPKVHPQREDYWGNVNPIGPRSCYDEGKRFAEALITAYRAMHGVETRMVRIFNTYGPRMRRDDGRALPNFISQALTNQPITVHGDGSQTRSFCYISDQIEGLTRLAESDCTDPVNIGNPVEVTILQVAREIVQLANSRSEIHLVPRPQDDPTVRQPDISRARKVLGWSPVVERTDGFCRTIEWFRGG